ncbi:MAG: DUF971 domain-containing protein [Phycisphaerales bacterium]|nr:MAG: DUF971 domain-containing protein [Phycisphaerales bacterium]
MPDERESKTSEATRAQGTAPNDDSAKPVDLKVKLAEQKLIVDWTDGRHSEYSLAMLRRHCLCAQCRTEREAQKNNPLTVLKTDPAGVRVTSASLVGSYAIAFQWSDGHDTGIYDFRYLRSLDDSA